MQRIAGLILVGIGLFVAILGGLALVIGLLWGGWEAWTMDGASQFNMLIWTISYLGPLFAFGLIARAIGKYLIRTAPPLEEVKLLPPR